MDVDTARKVLGRVTHAQRFPIGRLVPPVGLLSSSVRGLEELLLALRPEPRSLAGANLERLADWIERDVGDPACAAEVRLAVDQAPSYVDACLAVHDLIAERVRVARASLEAATAADRRDSARSGRK
jgi:hypothetical protein